MTLELAARTVERPVLQRSLEGAPELAVVVPCYCEAGNIGTLVDLLGAALEGIDWEAIIVDDDSPDGTADVARRIGEHDGRVRCLRRIGRRGLASAVIEGALASSARYIAVIDGDLQHDEAQLATMLRLLRENKADLVVGSRYVGGADAAGLSSPWRHHVTGIGIGIAERILHTPLADPMSGFFMMSRALLNQIAPRLTQQGFKILLDILLSAPSPLRVVEIPASLRARGAGESKLSLLVMLQFGGLLLDKTLHGLIPPRFIAFAAVGAVGVLINLAVLFAGRNAGLSFEQAQTLGMLVAMVCNFQLNNRLTYADQRLRGPRLWTGLLLFMLVCGVGGIANIGIATLLSDNHFGWKPAGAMGAAIGVVWNYAMSATLVWRPRRA